jgi:hypothetical protein
MYFADLIISAEKILNKQKLIEEILILFYILIDYLYIHI